jgi:hypothetical protein
LSSTVVLAKDEGAMKKLALIAVLLLAASPVAAQQQPLGAGGQTNASILPNTGVICEEEMTATFCNVPTSPNTGGFGYPQNRRQNRVASALHFALQQLPGVTAGAHLVAPFLTGWKPAGGRLLPFVADLQRV